MERLVTRVLTTITVYGVEEICCFIPITTQSVIEVGGVSGEGSLRNLVPCLVSFLRSEDWAARKATAEALGKLGVVERDLLCLKTFENRRFDKGFFTLFFLEFTCVFLENFELVRFLVVFSRKFQLVRFLDLSTVCWLAG